MGGDHDRAIAAVKGIESLSSSRKGLLREVLHAAEEQLAVWALQRMGSTQIGMGGDFSGRDDIRMALDDMCVDKLSFSC